MPASARVPTNKAALTSEIRGHPKKLRDKWVDSIFPPHHKHKFVNAQTCRRTSALAAERKDDQILRTVVVRDSSPGGLCAHETRDDHCASEKYTSVWAVRGSACNRTGLA